MGKLMPVNVRNKGINFFVDKNFHIEEETNDSIIMLVDNQTVEAKNNSISCSCDFYEHRGFCSHMATMEAFQKAQINEDTAPKRVVSKLTIATTPSEIKKDIEINKPKIPSQGSVFLEHLDILEDYQINNFDNPYHLEVFGEEFFDGDIEWKMKVYLPQNQKSYVVRHIGNFLTSLRDLEPTWFGSQQYTLSLEEFDEADRAFLQVLLDNASPEYKHNYHQSSFAANYMSTSGRSMNFEGYYFDKILDALSQLKHISFTDMFGNTYHQIYLQDFQANDNFFQFEVTDTEKETLFTMSSEVKSYFKDAGIIRDYNIFYKLSKSQQKLLNQLLTIPKIDGNRQLTFNREDNLLLSGYLEVFKELGNVITPDAYHIQPFEAVFEFDVENKHFITLNMSYQFENQVVSSLEDLQTFPYSYDHKKHQKIFAILKSSGLPEKFQSKTIIKTVDKKYHFFTKTLPLLEKLGLVKVSETLKAQFEIDHAIVEIGQLDGLLDISFDFESIDESDVDNALKALMDRKSYFMKRSGQVVAFDEGTQKISETLAQLRGQNIANGRVQLNRIEALRVSTLFENNQQVSFSESFKQLAYDITHPEDFPLENVAVKTDLRDYQLLGVKWLSSLNKYGFGGILADDMGLGKTIQAISFLVTHLEENKKALILAPASLIYNWKDEFEKFAPHLDVVVSYGNKSNRQHIISEQHQVTLTSYPSFRQDSDLFKKYKYDFLILDEAQMLKNNTTMIARALQEFDAKATFALSGTPIENRLTEIWSIFQVVMPGLFPNKREFNRMSTELVAHYISPFILRRRKEEVLLELPDLIEKTYTNELNDQQKAIYLAQLQQLQGEIIGQTDSELRRNRFEILAGLTRLRQICDTPQLFMPEVSETSGKLASLIDLMKTIRENGRRPLVFSQFTSMLEIVEKEFDKLGISTFTLTGQTPSQKRQEMTKAFNDGQKDAFLISLKAGGVGLNLTGADTVILIDLWWNPAVEMQAISRAHRMGQKQTVEVFRLITEGTIEEKILSMQKEKRDLVSTVLDGEEARSNLTVEDMKEILGIA